MVTFERGSQNSLLEVYDPYYVQNDEESNMYLQTG